MSLPSPSRPGCAPNKSEEVLDSSVKCSSKLGTKTVARATGVVCMVARRCGGGCLDHSHCPLSWLPPAHPLLLRAKPLLLDNSAVTLHPVQPLAGPNTSPQAGGSSQRPPAQRTLARHVPGLLSTVLGLLAGPERSFSLARHLSPSRPSDSPWSPQLLLLLHMLSDRWAMVHVLLQE